jgi:hypothetical protein
MIIKPIIASKNIEWALLICPEFPTAVKYKYPAYINIIAKTDAPITIKNLIIAFARPSNELNVQSPVAPPDWVGTGSQTINEGS